MDELAPVQDGSAGISRRGLMVGSLLSAAIATLSGCGSSDSGSTGGAKGKKVGLSMSDYNQLRWKAADERFFVEEAAKIGMDPIVAVADADVAKQVSQVRTMLTQGIGALCIAPVDSVASAAAAQAALAAKIPVVSYNFLIQNVKVNAFVGRDGVEVGRDLGRAALDFAPTGNYVLCLGDQGTVVAREKAQGIMEILDPVISSGNVKVVAQQYVKEWSPAGARQIVSQALTANNTIDAVVACNDGLASGSIQALQAAGLAGKTFVSGEDAEYTALKLVQEDLLKVTNFTDFEQHGRLAAQTVAKLLDGTKLDASATIENPNEIPWIKVDAFNVTKSDLDSFVKKYPWWTNSSFTGLGS
jgi:D-xylose transport system substrate-binding protein